MSSLSCAQYVECFNCTKALGCHFCAFDKQCHAYGSPYGCTFGLECPDFYQCVRTQSQYLGWGAISAVQALMVMGVVLLLVGVCLVLSIGVCKCCYCCYRRCCPKTHNDTEDGWTAVEDQYFGAPEQAHHSVLLAASSPSRDSLNAASESLEFLPDRTFSYDRLSWTSFSNDILEDNDRKCRQRRCCCPDQKFQACVVLLVVSAVLFVVGTTIGILYFPQPPPYSMCNKKIEWTSVLFGLSHGLLAADVDIHLSLWNPNRYALGIVDADIQLLYQDTSIAQGVVSRQVLFPAGTITDIVVLMRFHPTFAQALSMYEKHLTSQLLFDVALRLQSALSLFETNLYRFNTSFVVSDLDPRVPDSRTYCKCPG